MSLRSRSSHWAPRLIVTLTSAMYGMLRHVFVLASQCPPKSLHACSSMTSMIPLLSLRHAPAEIEPGRRVAYGIRLNGSVGAAGSAEKGFPRDPFAKRNLLLLHHRARRGIQGQKTSAGGDRENSVAARIPARIDEPLARHQRVQPSAALAWGEPIENERVAVGLLDAQEASGRRIRDGSAAPRRPESLCSRPVDLHPSDLTPVSFGSDVKECIGSRKGRVEIAHG